MASLLNDINKTGDSKSRESSNLGATNTTELIEYDVNNDEELTRIRASIQNMEKNGGVYTGKLPIDMTPSKIHSITNLVGELEKRGVSKDVWELRAEQVYKAFTSPTPPSKEEFFDLMETLMPLTTEQTEDAVSLLSQRSKVSRKIAFDRSNNRGASSFSSPSSSPSSLSKTTFNRNKYNESNDSFFKQMLDGANTLSSSIGKRTTLDRVVKGKESKITPKTDASSNFMEKYGTNGPSLHELATGNASEFFIRKNNNRERNDINNTQNHLKIEIKPKTPLPTELGEKKSLQKKHLIESSFHSPNNGLTLVDLLTYSPRDIKKENITNHLLSALRRHIRRRALTIPSLFAMWDKNRDGLLTKRNLKNGLLNFGIETTTDEINRFFECLDEDGTGRITLKRFMNVLKYKTRFGSPNPYVLTGRKSKSVEKRKDDKNENNTEKSVIERKNSNCDEKKASTLLDLEEARVAKIYRRLSMTETKSSKEWLQLKEEDRILSDGSNNRRGAEDPTPRALLAKIRARMKRRTLQTSQFFSYCDTNRGGEISIMELANGMKYLGMDLTSKQLKALWKTMDIDGDGRLSFMEFKLALGVAGSGPTMALINHEEEGGDISGTFAPILRACVMPDRLEKLRQKLRAAAYVLDGENLRQLFEKLDIHKDGYLPVERFKQVVKSIYPMKTEELNAVYKLCDKKNVGKVRYEEFEAFIHGEGGVGNDGLILKERVKPKLKEKTLGEILLAMQKQQQRTILLNPPLFSGVYVSGNTEEGVKQLLMQFRLIGFDITAKDAKKLLDTFGTEKSSFKLLHSILVAKKIIASSYISNLDELLRRFEKYDADNSGSISIKQFEKVLNEVVELNAVESKLLLRILDYNDSNSIAYKHLFEFSRDEIHALEIPPPEMKTVELLKPRNDSMASNLTMKLMRLKHLVSRSDAAGGQLNLRFLRDMDRNMDGILTREELYKGVDHEARLDGVYMTNEQVEEVLEILDAKKSGIIKLSKLEKFEKLDHIRCKLKANTYSHDGKDPSSIFRLISRGEKEIDLDDFVETLNRICHLSGSELGMLLHQVDISDDGTINKDEFAAFLKDIRVLE